MNPNEIAAYKALEQAQQAIRQGNKALARQFAEEAVRMAPDLEDAWLLMGASAPSAADSVACLRTALELNPASERAQKGLAWAESRLQKEEQQRAAAAPVSLSPPAEEKKTEPTQPVRVTPVEMAATAEDEEDTVQPVAALPLPVSEPQAAPKAEKSKKTSKRSRYAYAALLLLLLCGVLAFAISQGVTPASAFINSGMFAAQDAGPAWAAADVTKPTYTLEPSPTTAFTATSTATATESPTPTATFTATATATATVTDTPTITNTPLPSDTPSITPTSEASPTALPTDTSVPTALIPTQSAPQVKNTTGTVTGAGEHWIDVNLSQQMVYAYEGNTLVASFVVSTGTWQYPTVTGQYRVYIKYRYKDMSGPGYFLPDVPYTMFFYKGYALHGTYWHNNFGTPMSHGCVNLTISDAEWLYNFSSVGTLVNVHY